MKRKTIRELDEKDIEILLEMEKDFPSPWPRQAFFIEFEGEFNKSIGLEIDDRLVGYILYSYYRDEININHFVVDKSQRRRGYAKILLDELIKRQTKKQIIYLEVAVDNDPAINLYKKYGFKILTRRKNYYGQDRDAYIMQKDRKERL